MLNIAGVGCAVLAAAALFAWLLGRVLSDRWGWSQWLLWIPTPAALLACGLGLAGAARPAGGSPARRRRLAAWGAAAALVAIYFLALEHRFVRLPRRSGDGLRIVHWSVHATGPRVLQRHADAVTALGGDVTVLSTLLAPNDVGKLTDRLPDLGESVVRWPFVLVTRLPILTSQPLVANQDVHAALFQVRDAGDRVLTIWAVDLPSQPKRRRAEIARKTRRILDGLDAPAPDLVVGDFNMTRGSASLKMVFPDLRHAFDQAGWGYGATFHRALPLYHIDHALLGPRVRAQRYRLVDTGIGRHRAQVVELEE